MSAALDQRLAASIEAATDVGGDERTAHRVEARLQWRLCHVAVVWSTAARESKDLSERGQAHWHLLAPASRAFDLRCLLAYSVRSARAGDRWRYWPYVPRCARG